MLSTRDLAGAVGARATAERIPLSAARCGWREVAVCSAIALAICAGRVVQVGGMQFYNDSYQYLSVAKNLRDHGAVATSLVYFDTERARGVVPAPLTTFPPGYPLLIALLSKLGLSLEHAALLLSMAGFLAVLPLLLVAGRSLGLTPTATRVAMLVWAVSAQSTLYGICLLTEGLFSAVLLGAVVLLVRTDAQSGRWRIPAGCALLAVGYGIRYATLLLIAGAHAYALVHLVTVRHRRRAWLAGLALCDGLVSIVLVRNLIVTGTWQGGNTKAFHNPVLYTVKRAGVTLADLLFGEHLGVLRFPSVLFAAATAAALVALALLALRERRRIAAALAEERLLLVVLPAVYFAAVFYLCVATVVWFSTRLFVPLIPICGLVLGVVLTALTDDRGRLPRAAAAATALFAAGFVAVNLAQAFVPPHLAPHRWAARALALPTADGRPLATWLGEHLPRGARLLAMEAQATGYLVDRPAIAISGTRFSDIAWTEARMREDMQAFGAEWAVVYPDAVATGSEDDLGSPFLQDLAQRRIPAWLEVVAENPRALVLRVRR
ncbi:MAG: hypothetical protein ACJ79R_12505 [Anaeromyxobacteraceae bacterium]